MKKYIFYLTISAFIAFNIKCSKDLADLFPPPDKGEMVLIKVKEYKTNLPLSGVMFSTYSCKQYDIEFGNCIDQVLFSSCITDNNGICNCSFPNINFEKITIEKSMYWPRIYSENSYEYMIEPKAWVNINFMTDVEYPTTSYFFITVNGEKGFERSFVQAANNSNSILTLFGNEENMVDWVLYKAFNSTSEILKSGNFILKPNKFENLSYTLNY